MPDIAMCYGSIGAYICPQKDKCYRFTATPSEWRQSYFVELPMKEDQTCEHYWDNKPYKQQADGSSKQMD